MKKGLTELVFILDRSSSMAGLESDTIGGYNSMLAKQRVGEGDCRITTVLFNHSYTLLHDHVDIREVSDITEQEYQVGGMTALLDAIGLTIGRIASGQRYAPQHCRADKVLFVIITDGEENSSREYSTAKVKALIEQQQARYGWEFIFLGANIDAVQTAGSFGIAPNRAVDYLADSQGTELNFKVMTKAISEFRATGVVDEASFTDIRNDLRQRGGRE